MLEFQLGEGLIHRKGAAPSSSSTVLIPGSRGALSYIVKPIKSSIDHGWSLAHGAGRKWDRGSAKGKLENKYRQAELVKTKLGSRVLCTNKDLLYEEAPEAYKSIDRVIADMEGMGLIKVVASLRPLLTYKTNEDRRR